MKRAIAVCLCLGAAGSVAAEEWVGQASYYGYQGRTASGGHTETLTAAHRSLPFGTPLRVTNVRNGRSVVVRVNDRGPFVRGRIIDVSAQAADALNFRRAGTAMVKIERIAN